MNEIGRKTFFWYRIYLATLALIYLALIVFGLVLVIAQPETREYDSQQVHLMGILYAAFGTVFFLAFAVALFLPPKPYNWVVGLVLMAFGMTSCCFVPFLIPLVIYWLKPETKAFFGRN